MEAGEGWSGWCWLLGVWLGTAVWAVVGAGCWKKRRRAKSGEWREEERGERRKAVQLKPRPARPDQVSGKREATLSGRQTTFQESLHIPTASTTLQRATTATASAPRTRSRTIVAKPAVQLKHLPAGPRAAEGGEAGSGGAAAGPEGDAATASEGASGGAGTDSPTQTLEGGRREGRSREVTRDAVTAEQLSDYEGRKGSRARQSAPPSLPPLSDREAREAAQRKAARPTRLPLRFAPKGKVKLVPRDQTSSWDVNKSRLLPNPQRRLHVVQTIGERGGWLIDRDAPDTGQLDRYGDKLVPYVRVSPTHRPTP